MEKVVLNATRRTTTGKKVGAMRRAGQLPGVLYGHNMEATPITLDMREASRLLPTLTASSLITIRLDGKDFAVLVRERQRNFIRNELLHVDFQAVSLTEKIRTNVNIVVTGTAPAVKDFNGIVVTGLTALDVESLPQDLPERFIVDISSLARIGDGIAVRDIQVSENVTVFNDPDELVVHVTGASAEEEVTEGEGPAEPEVIERGKKEEDEE